jgi:hypothetical protein
MFDLIVKMQSLVSAANNLGCGGEHCPTQWGINASQPRSCACEHVLAYA